MHYIKDKVLSCVDGHIIYVKINYNKLYKNIYCAIKDHIEIRAREERNSNIPNIPIIGRGRQTDNAIIIPSHEQSAHCIH